MWNQEIQHSNKPRPKEPYMQKNIEIFVCCTMGVKLHIILIGLQEL